MSATKLDVKPEFVTPESEGKPEFNASSLDALIEKINRDPGLLQGDWREIVRSEFRLSTEQARSLVDVSQDRVEEVQNYFVKVAELIRRGGAIKGRIVRMQLEEQTPDAVHVVQIELQLPRPALQTLGVPLMFRIAHCDAHCRNWRWDSW